MAGSPTERFPPLSLFGDLDTAQRRSLSDPLAGSVSLPYDKSFDRRYVVEVLRSGTTPNGVFGVKMHWPQFIDARKRLENYLNRSDLSHAQVLAQVFPRLSYISLKRRDKLAQAISWCRALQSGEFRRLKGAGTAGAAAEKALQFDYKTIRRLLSALTSFDNSWDTFFRTHDIVPLCVRYEDLANDYERTIRATLEALGITHSDPIAPPRSARQADSISEDWTRQFYECVKQTAC